MEWFLTAHVDTVTDIIAAAVACATVEYMTSVCIQWGTGMASQYQNEQT